MVVGFFCPSVRGFPNKNDFEKPQLQRLQITWSNTAGTGTFPEHNHLSHALIPDVMGPHYFQWGLTDLLLKTSSLNGAGLGLSEPSLAFLCQLVLRKYVIPLNDGFYLSRASIANRRQKKMWLSYTDHKLACYKKKWHKQNFPVNIILRRTE